MTNPNPPTVTARRYRRDRAAFEQPQLAPLDAAIVTMIRAHVGKPCPTRREIMGWTGVPRTKVWKVLADMQARGLIEVEVQEAHEAGKDPKRRRVRVAGEVWTEWTARRPVSGKVAA